MGLDLRESVKLVIFDMDGLMFATEQISIEGWKRAGELLGVPIRDEHVFQLLGLSVPNAKKTMVRLFGEEFRFDEARDIRVRYVSEYMKEHGVPVKKGLFELLDVLDREGIRKAVATSTEREKAEPILEQAGVLARFDAVVCGDMVTKGKPDPEIFLTAAELCGVEPERCLVLEDSFHGIMAAARAKMIPIMVPDLLQPDSAIQELLYKKCESLLDLAGMF